LIDFYSELFPRDRSFVLPFSALTIVEAWGGRSFPIDPASFDSISEGKLRSNLEKSIDNIEVDAESFQKILDFRKSMIGTWKKIMRRVWETPRLIETFSKIEPIRDCFGAIVTTDRSPSYQTALVD